MRFLILSAGILLWLPAAMIAEFLIRVGELVASEVVTGIFWLDMAIAGVLVGPALAGIALGLVESVLPSQPAYRQEVIS